jgi:hypothetical protein
LANTYPFDFIGSLFNFGAGLALKCRRYNVVALRTRRARKDHGKLAIARDDAE